MNVAEAPSRARDPEGLARIVAAARTCFTREGAKKTRMAAVAGEAGVVRQTVYDFVSSRRELLELALAERLLELADVILGGLDVEGGEVSDALVEGMAVIIETVGKDPEFVDISEALGPAEAIRFWTGPSAAQAAAVKAMEPFYERAVSEDALRPGLTLDEMASWIRFVCSPLTARSDLDAKALRGWLARFALPPLLNQQHLP
jgi:TetR/AcrR family transcriptional regulator, repressor for uid operon